MDNKTFTAYYCFGHDDGVLVASDGPELELDHEWLSQACCGVEGIRCDFGHFGWLSRTENNCGACTGNFGRFGGGYCRGYFPSNVVEVDGIRVEGKNVPDWVLAAFGTVRPPNMDNEI